MRDYTQEVVKRGKWTYSLKTKEKLLSPTWLLRPLNNYTMTVIPPHLLETSRLRGKDLATAIEIYEEHDEVMIDHETTEPLFNAYLEWKKTHGVEVLETEYYVADHKGGTHGYIDLMIKIKGKLIAVEIKTRQRDKKGNLNIKSNDLVQNKIYSNALGNKVPFYILIITPEGEWVFEKMLFTKEHDTTIQTLKNFRYLLGKTKIEGDK